MYHDCWLMLNKFNDSCHIDLELICYEIWNIYKMQYTLKASTTHKPTSLDVVTIWKSKGSKSMIHICEMTPNISQPLLNCESPFLYRKWTAYEISGSKICELYKTKDPENERFFDISLPNFNLVKITLYDFGIFYLQNIIKYIFWMCQNKI